MKRKVKRAFKKGVAISLFLVFVLLVGFSFLAGRSLAFQDICQEKCWLNRDTRDIECISFLMK